MLIKLNEKFLKDDGIPVMIPKSKPSEPEECTLGEFIEWLLEIDDQEDKDNKKKVSDMILARELRNAEDYEFNTKQIDRILKIGEKFLFKKVLFELVKTLDRLKDYE